ncbi:THAP domain-containing protein 1 isoform X2 [Solenopsis invicta]|uniref:THAP domain-containing protein 1 isoform X2 n=1 Tax=Solenopsis invicta TaxID=13686 RepID=UPI000E33D88A|nr:THAP domain-containing protein 1 isoform X2 [Solenopsis invicta]
MSYCIVFGCNNRVAKKNHEQLENERAKNKKFSFHVFPQNIEKRNKWLEAINLKNYTPPKTSAVCSAHFREDDYEPGLLCRKLKKDAIPNLLKEESTEYQETESVIENIEHYTVDTSNERNEERMETISSTMADRSTSISPSRIFNSPTKVHLQLIGV